MNRFRARRQSQATLATPVEQVWGVLTDPALLAELTPMLREIDVDGDIWTWKLTRIPVLSEAIAPTFSEVMTFREPEWIGFRHDTRRDDERTGVEGTYDLRRRDDGSEVAIDLEVWVDLPLPRVAAIGVQTAMHGVIATMGQRFSANLRQHLGE